jgi:hypothetical protein
MTHHFAKFFNPFIAFVELLFLRIIWINIHIFHFQASLSVEFFADRGGVALSKNF